MRRKIIQTTKKLRWVNKILLCTGSRIAYHVFVDQTMAFFFVENAGSAALMVW